MNGDIIKTDTEEQREETKKRLKKLKEKNGKLPTLF